MNRTLALIALVVAGMPSASRAQAPGGAAPTAILARLAAEQVPAQAPSDTPTVITLRPAAEPLPALKYRLVPERRALVPGNAAVFYHRAIQIVIVKGFRSDNQAKPAPGQPPVSVEEQVSRWINGPLAEIPRDQAANQLEAFQRALNEVELGALRLTCDWEFDQRQEGLELLLPEIQEMRSLARLVALKARLAILSGRTDEAMHWIEVGLVMGRHVSQGPSLIQALVGVAIDSVMLQCLEDLIQTPGTPSLYWALADRPRPFIDMRYPLEGERYLLEKELPELSALDQGAWSLDEARRFAGELQRKLFTFASGTPTPGTRGAGPNDLPAAGRRLGIAAMAAKIYPEARRTLISRGRTQAEVEGMPVIQVAALYTIQEYQRVRDERYKWMNLPYWQSAGRADQDLPRTVEEKLTNPLLTMFRLLTPALNSALLAGVRLERKLDALECVEAVRLYAAAHEGKLPASLEAITEAPVPPDPATGKPFMYKLEGDTATLTAPVPAGAPNHPAYAIHYVLKLAK